MIVHGDPIPEDWPMRAPTLLLVTPSGRVLHSIAATASSVVCDVPPELADEPSYGWACRVPQREPI